MFCLAAVQFAVCIQNRYKLNKKYRKILPANADDGTPPPESSLEAKSLMAQAKVS